VLAMVLESLALRTAYREAKSHKAAGQSWWQYIRKSKHPELPVVLLEDAGAETGLIFALFGVLMAHFTDEPRWDAVGSIGIGVLLVVIAIVLAIEMKGLLIGEAASAGDVAKITAALQSAPGVVGVIHMKTQHLAPDEVLVAARLEFESNLTVADLAERISGAERALRAAVPSATLSYLEPDIRRD